MFKLHRNFNKQLFKKKKEKIFRRYIYIVCYTRFLKIIYNDHMITYIYTYIGNSCENGIFNNESRIFSHLNRFKIVGNL